MPYLPFSEAFGRLAAESPALAESLVATGPGVARLMPARRVLSDETGEDTRAHPADRSDRIDRADLFESVHAILEQLGRSAPLLLVIEDVHWADQSTRELLSFLFTRRFESGVRVLASYRSDDLHRRHPLRTAAAEWSRLPGITRLDLGRLPDDDVRSLVRSLHPSPLADRDLRGIVERAEGNAFFTEELVAAAELGTGSLPGGLADLLLVRLDQLDDSGRQVVRAAAVSGRRVSHELLDRVTGVGPGALDAALRAAVERNVLVPAGGDGYAFRHALLAEAVYDDLLPGERVRLHAAYVEALTTHRIAGTAAELARHGRAANDLVTAARASIAAGDEAMTVGGPDEAARHYETALELVSDPTVAAALGDDVNVVDLVLRTCEAAVAAGQVFRAIALAQDQLHSLPAGAPVEDRAHLLYALGSSVILVDSTTDLLAITTEAMQLVPADSPSALGARAMALHARANVAAPARRRRRAVGDRGTGGRAGAAAARRGRRRVHDPGPHRGASRRPGLLARPARAGHRAGPLRRSGRRRAARPVQPRGAGVRARPPRRGAADLPRLRPRRHRGGPAVGAVRPGVAGDGRPRHVRHRRLGAVPAALRHQRPDPQRDGGPVPDVGAAGRRRRPR